MKLFLLLALCLCASVAGAQNFAVRYWSNESATAYERTNGIDGSLLSQIRDIGTNTAVPPGFTAVLTAAQVATATDSRRPEVRAWKQTADGLANAARANEETKMAALDNERRTLEAKLDELATNFVAANSPGALTNIARLLILERQLNRRGDGADISRVNKKQE